MPDAPAPIDDQLRPEPELVDEILDLMERDYPDFEPGTRPAHTKGIVALGYFRGSPVAHHYSRAAHFGTGWTPVTVRFSNANGQNDPDWTPQVRGMAIRFHNHSRFEPVDDWARAEIVPKTAGTDVQLADLVCMSIPMFMVTAGEDLPDFGRAMIPRPVRFHPWWKRLWAWLRLSPLPPQHRRHSRWSRLKAGLRLTPPLEPERSPDQGVLEWVNDHPEGLPFLLANAQVQQSPPPESYVRTVYYAVHAFEVENGDGLKRMGRFTLEPASGVRHLIGPRPSNDDDHELGPPGDYLQHDLRERLADTRTARFNLHLQIADPGDPTDDPTALWPSNRKYVRMGTLELHHVVADQPGTSERLGFNPGRLVDGVNLSDDPTLHTRIGVYAASQRRRGCPFMPSD